MKNKKNPNKLSIETIRIYAEKVARKIIEHDNSFAQENEMYIFLSYKNILRYENHIEIMIMRQMVLFIIHASFKDVVYLEDVALIFRYQDANSVQCALVYFKKKNLSRYAELTKKILDEIQKDTSFWKPNLNEGRVSVTVRLGKESVDRMIPYAQIEYNQKIFFFLEQETGYNQKTILQCNKSIKMSRIRYVVIYLFSKKFPDADTLFLAHIIARDRSHISTIFNKIHDCYFSPLLKEQEDVVEFWNLVEKISKRLNTEPIKSLA